MKWKAMTAVGISHQKMNPRADLDRTEILFDCYCDIVQGEGSKFRTDPS